MKGVRPHRLTQEFPEFCAVIDELKQHDSHFARLLGKYTETDREICHYAQKAYAVPSSYLEQLKKWRLRLKDELYAILTHRSQQQLQH
ncbi:MAG: hypothetical protein FD130_2509 [Halothiobacillaceae bacterium]|nr:MAG: hypothetical protein FD130_2509 [Halothiobacillaceae bacterium]